MYIKLNRIKFHSTEILLFTRIIKDYFQSVLDENEFRFDQNSFQLHSLQHTLSSYLFFLSSLSLYIHIYIFLYIDFTLVGIHASCPTINYTSIYRAVTEIYHGLSPCSEIYSMQQQSIRGVTN